MAHGDSGAKSSSPRADALRWWRGEKQTAMGENSPRLDTWYREREGSPADVAEGAFNMVAPLGMYAGDVEGAPLGKLAKSASFKVTKDTPSDILRSLRSQTVKDPVRNAFPGIYANPREIIASQTVAPEDPMLRQLFGVTREDLANTALSRKGNLPDWQPPAMAANPKGSAVASQLITPRNTRRVSDILGEGMKRKDLAEGMLGWYVQDPMFKRMVEMFGPEEAMKRFKQMNTVEGMFSPGSEVLTELNRGSLATKMLREGRFDEFAAKGGKQRPGDPDFANVMGHPYHSTAHVKPMQSYIETGALPKSDKVPSYITASQVPEIGFQTHRPVADAHFSRGVGLADVRQNQAFAASADMPEVHTLLPWYQKIAAQHGIEPVAAQGLQWGGMAKQTGVTTPVGAPKLELRAQQIAKAAAREGVTPETMRDLYLSGKRQIGEIDPVMAALIAGGSGAAAALRQGEPR
jgi:hypothetical protein